MHVILLDINDWAVFYNIMFFTVKYNVLFGLFKVGLVLGLGLKHVALFNNSA